MCFELDHQLILVLAKALRYNGTVKRTFEFFCQLTKEIIIVMQFSNLSIFQSSKPPIATHHTTASHPKVIPLKHLRVSQGYG